MKIFFSIFLFLIYGSVNCFAQTPVPPLTTEEEKAEETNRGKAAVASMVNSHKYKIGILRILPMFNANSGYDSDAVLRDEEFIGDYFVSAEPAAGVAVKLGSRSYAELVERVTFVYYKELDERRDIFNNTRGRFVTGGSKILTMFEGGYYRRDAPVNEEVDVPLEHSVADGGVAVQYSLSSRIHLHSDFRLALSKYENQQDLDDSLPTLVNRRTYSAGAGTNYLLRQNLSITADFRYGVSDVVDSDSRSETWSVHGGLSFTRRRLTGHVAVGYGFGGPEEGTSTNTFLLNADVNLRVTDRITLGVFAGRHLAFSDLIDSGVRVTTTAGARATIQITQRLSLGGSYSIGISDYNDQLIVDGVVVENDSFQRGDLTAGYRIYKGLSLRGGLIYYKRDTEITVFDRERLNYAFGIAYSTTL